MATKKKTAKKKIKKEKKSNFGKIYLSASFNNTLITITDEKGQTLSWGSAGASGAEDASARHTPGRNVDKYRKLQRITSRILYTSQKTVSRRRKRPATAFCFRFVRENPQRAFTPRIITNGGKGQCISRMLRER